MEAEPVEAWMGEEEAVGGALGEDSGGEQERGGGGGGVVAGDEDVLGGGEEGRGLRVGAEGAAIVELKALAGAAVEKVVDGGGEINVRRGGKRYGRGEDEEKRYCPAPFPPPEHGGSWAPCLGLG